MLYKQIHKKMKTRFERSSTSVPESIKKAYKVGEVVGELASGKVILAYSPERVDKWTPAFRWMKKRVRAVVRDSRSEVEKFREKIFKRNWKNGNRRPRFRRLRWTYMSSWIFRDEVWFVM